MSDILESNIRIIRQSGRTSVHIRKSEYTWTIDGFSCCPHEPGMKIDSPKFSSGKDKLWLVAYPGGNDISASSFLSLELQMTKLKGDNKMKYVISLIDNEQKEVSSSKKSWYNNNKATLPRFIKRQFVLDATNGLLRDDKLTILLRAEFFEMTAIDESSDQDNYPFLNAPERKVIEDFSNLFKAQELSDVVISVNRREIKAHKFVLSARSPVFRAMFSHAMIENNSNQVNLSHIDKDVVQEMLEFIYTGKTPSLDTGGPEKKGFVTKLLEAAHTYQLTGLVSICGKFLAKSLTTNSAVTLYTFARQFNATKLRDEALSYIRAHANVIVGTAIWSTFMRENPGLASEVFKAMAK